MTLRQLALNKDDGHSTVGLRLHCLAPTPRGTRGKRCRITNDAREDEMDRNLGHVANVVGELRSMAVDMNNEIAVHNRKLDDIYTKADDNQGRMTVAQNQAERIIGYVFGIVINFTCLANFWDKLYHVLVDASFRDYLNVIIRVSRRRGLDRWGNTSIRRTFGYASRIRH
ncbi:unnamed protein product [Dibothriocephalus latus]|uniref:t-SNARE coiled-coil homology domain-containing protein n=1 Tax=Dibothriocephalus latus TaxID=60516 RepID=A0A3P7N4Y6_DIBLA|nr:unnamed protein product [Dibothriocephalus latus]